MRKSFLLLSALLLASVLFAQTEMPHADIISRLKTFLAQQKPERAYLQFDKPYYEAGDTIYFKAYITEGDRHQPSDLSGVLHVNLINSDNKIAQSIKLHNENGTCNGDFALPGSLTAGIYRVRAYTEWMRNNGERDFFERAIEIGSFNKPDVLPKQPKAIETRNDLQFFPEGGSLVTGIYTKIAFKAIGTNGQAINVKGIILDNSNKEVGSFASTHLGMGYFFLRPDSSTYKAKVTFKDGTQNTIDLPKPAASGISLIINNDSAVQTIISVRANAEYFKLNRNKDFLLILYSQGRVLSAPFKLDDAAISLTIKREQLHVGIVTVTLFSSDGLPLCERLLFIQNDDGIALDIHPDKIFYNKKEKVSLLLNAKSKTIGDTTGNFSVSVIDESRVPADELVERNILTELLLTQDLKGYVEQPNYYFIDTIKDARNNLDVLMLTQGFRNFEWKQVLDTAKPIVKYQPEKGLQINGMTSSIKGVPIPNEAVNLIPSGGGSLLTSTSDDNGIFHFSNLIFTDTVHFVIGLENSKQKNSTRLTYLPAINGPAVLPYKPDASLTANARNIKTYMDGNRKYLNQASNDFSDNVIVLKEAKVKNGKASDTYRTQSLAGSGNADQTLNADALEKIQGTLTTRLNGRLTGVGFSNGTPYLQAPVIRGQSSSTVNSPMLIIVDGTEVNPGGSPFDLDQIDASEVETVEVLKYASTSAYGVEGANGVLVITTRLERGSLGNVAQVGILPIAAMGFYRARTFYSPKYEYSGSATIPDHRSTIYWNPNIRPGKDGNASFSYYNSDGTGTYKVTIEGIDSDGNIGRLVYRYQVK